MTGVRVLDFAGAGEAAEKGVDSRERPETHTPGAKAHVDLSRFLPGINPRPWSFYIFQRLFWDLRVSVVILESVCLVYN